MLLKKKDPSQTGPMDFLLKRIPAFSRALGEWESDEESDTDIGLEENFPCVGPVGKLVSLSHVFEQITVKNVLIGIGPLQTAFITCGYQLTKENLVAVISYSVPGFGGTKKTVENQVHLHHNPGVGGGTLFVLIPASKQIPHVNLRRVAQFIMGSLFCSSDNLHRNLQVTILCTQPVYQFQSHSLPHVPSFIRILATEQLEKPKDAQWDWLEQPNIVSGQAAEFLTWCKIHSVSAVLYVLFYTTLDNPGYAWHSAKEMFQALCQMRTISPILASVVANWDLDDSMMRDSCVMYICGDKPSKMDQMYT